MDILEYEIDTMTDRRRPIDVDEARRLPNGALVFEDDDTKVVRQRTQNTMAAELRLRYRGQIYMGWGGALWRH